jgi:hypothetical protein
MDDPASYAVEEIDGRLYVVGGGIEAIPVASIGDGFDVIADLESSPTPSIIC